MGRLLDLHTALRKITERCRVDMAEPDEQGVYGTVYGAGLDNTTIAHPNASISKMADNVSNLNLGVHIVRGKDRLNVNIADLIALAKMANPELVKVQEE